MSRLLPRLPTTLRALRAPLARPYSSSSSSSSSSAFKPSPAPPRLPASEQAEFERLQRTAAVASGFDMSPPSPAEATETTTAAAPGKVEVRADDGEALHQDVRRGAPPEFEGETNPKTGEVGGPKNEPLRWGGDGDWSYNGRVTDF
ncbi:uncharacterized protein VDAG_03876 [Verticillium dahliae VdLs.17]|uniref:Succinate dehydrogenase assembly factor 4, mitochondrial n=2 Tax=Verticillium dahliae TaxID=27337 RepID=G2X0U7_VERDV|nr:uncharacterized protein VDAG_03876 [Verticillium dahliae VdLs.17]KAF3343936.1 Zinc finger FYVE domain-containing protein 19 [Verticillium dahliae VDG2]KAH6667103.1 hypothetical protein EV126DRAFT_395449 [Verticillium dahliae]EGY22438.1 hypothetical protein VDAG_03876 [Verticillium dahliae VdLs.17]KAH6704854.1 hypothetical protein EV126DRAFT_458509 [Verticillium dahliae]PNH31710.1 hypothetical protein BJF96_g5090 [Verticillium dahliae]